MFKGRIQNLIIQADLFGSEPKLYTDRSLTYKSLFGAVISIVVAIATLVGFYHFGKELILKKSPSVIFSKDYDENPPQFNITLDKFNFFLGVQDPKENYYKDDSIYKIKASLLTTRRINKDNGDISYETEKIELNLEDCDLDRHFSNYKNLFEGMALNNLYCVDPEQSNKLKLAGAYGMEEFSHLNVEVLPCQNSTDQICKPKEIINQFLKGYFVINLIDNLFKPQNYTEPSKKLRRNFFTSISPDYSKYMHFYMKNVDYETDAGFLMEDFSLKKYLQFDYHTESIDLTSQESVVNMNLRLSYFRDIYSRRYVKVQEIFAQMGGLIKGIMIVIQLVYSPIARNDFLFKLIDDIYTFPHKKKEARIGPTTIEKSTFKLITVNKSQINRDDVINDNIKLEHVDKYFKSKNQFKLKLSFCQRLKTFSCNSSSNDAKLIQKKLTSKLDILKLIKLQYEHEKLRDVLLNNDQNNLFCIFKDLNLYDSDTEFAEDPTKKSQDLKNLINKLDSRDDLNQRLKREIIKISVFLSKS